MKEGAGHTVLVVDDAAASAGSSDVDVILPPGEVDAIISKPFALEELANVVRELARR